MKRVAFIGAGNMGGRMARRVHDAGYELTVCDPSPSVRERFGVIGARVTTDPGDCAACDLVIIMVATTGQMKDVLLGPGGVLARVDRAAPPTVAIMSTVLPKDAGEVRAPLVAAGIPVVDAPISGGLVGAEEGTLAVMVGGEERDIAPILPVLQVMGRNIFRCGAFGSGQFAKIINNMLGIASVYLSAEAFQIALRHGVAFERLAPVIEAASGRNFFSQSAASIRPAFGAWAETPEAFESFGSIIRKDLGLARTLSAEAGLDLPLLDAVIGAVADPGEDAFRRWREVAEAPG